MTIIFVAAKNKHKLLMAGDRRYSTGNGACYIAPTPKVQKIGKTLVGFCGLVQLKDVFMDLKELPNLEKAEDVGKYVRAVLVPAYKKELVKLGYMHKERVETDIRSDDSPETQFLVVCKGRIFEINTSVNIVSSEEVSAPCGIGCGSESATAIYHTLDNISYMAMYVSNPKDMLRRTLEFTAQLNAGCDDNIDIISE